MRSEGKESFRKAAVALAQRVSSAGQNAVLVAAATRREGTTTAVLNLALHLKESCGLRPLIVEMNLSHPSLGRALGLNPDRGVYAVGAGTATPRECVQDTSLGVPVLPAGRNPSNNGVATGTAPLLKTILGGVAGDYDVVLVDMPPILQRADTVAAVSVVPSVVLVIEAGRARYEMLERVKTELAEAGATIVGTILNKHKRFIPGWVYRMLVK